jgi:hypothetical protein
MCVVNLKSVNKLDLTWKQSFLIILIALNIIVPVQIAFVLQNRVIKLDV